MNNILAGILGFMISIAVFSKPILTGLEVINETTACEKMYFRCKTEITEWTVLDTELERDDEEE